jgi:alpha-1,6-mannosyltransferase
VIDPQDLASPLRGNLSPGGDGGVPRDPGGDPPWATVILLGACLVALSALGPTRNAVAWALLPWSGAFLALLHLWRRHPGWLGRPGVLLGGAVLLRLLFLLPVQDLSDDLFRYVWDGWLGIRGIPPYRFVPEDPALLAFQDDVLFREMNSPGYHSVYPPLSQLVFLLGGWAHDLTGWPASGRAIRIGFVALELGGILALFRALAPAASPTISGSGSGSRAMGRSGEGRAALALYAWNPLVLVAVAGSGHSEGGLVLGLGILLWGVRIRHPGVAWTGLALGVLAKGLPLLLAPLLWRQLRGTASLRQTLAGLTPAILVATALCAPFLRVEDLPRIWSSTELYVHLFEFNAGLYALLHQGARHLLGLEVRNWLGTALRGVALGGALWIGLRHRTAATDAFARGSLLILSLYLVTATTVHPWYLLWILPFLPFTRTGREAWLWGAWASFFTYLVYEGVNPVPISVLFWGGMAVLALHASRETLFRPLRRVAARRKARWVDPWIEGATVLDVGGAEGDVAAALRRRRTDLSVTVLDPDPGGMDRPLHVDRPLYLMSASRVRGDACALPVAERSVDTVLLVFVLHHVLDAERALAEALRVARRRVVILESTYEGRLEHRLLAAMDRWVNAGRGDGRMGREESPLRHRRRGEWLVTASTLGARVVVADRPRGSVHRVLRLVLEPADPGGAIPATSEGAPQAPEEFHP